MRRLLWELQWSHPNLDMGPYYWQMVGRPTYALDRDTRESLPRRLGQLVSHLREQGFSGLVLVIDELESFLDLAGNQRPIFQYVFNNLLNSVPENCVLAFASTTALSDTLEWVFQRPLTPRFESPVLTKEHALEIAKRVSKLHATAFSWEPPVKPSDLVEYAWRKVSLAVSGKWRAYIQMVLRQLEILEQSRHRPSAPHLRPLPAVSAVINPLMTRPLAAQSITSGATTLLPGNTVQIMRGTLRGWHGRIESVDQDGRAEVVLDTHVPTRSRVRLTDLKRISRT